LDGARPLNPVECHFFPIGEFVLNNADYLAFKRPMLAR